MSRVMKGFPSLDLVDFFLEGIIESIDLMADHYASQDSSGYDRVE